MSFIFCPDCKRPDCGTLRESHSPADQWKQEAGCLTVQLSIATARASELERELADANAMIGCQRTDLSAFRLQRAAQLTAEADDREHGLYRKFRVERLLTPAERRNYLALCREHGAIVTGFFARGEAELIERNAVVRIIRRELDWYIDLQQRRWRALDRRRR